MNLVYYGDERLSTPAQPITEIDEEVRRLAQAMLATMYERKGLGLAAPQVGVSKRLVVIDTGTGPMALVNPEIVEHGSEEEPGEEGCLSLPEVYLILNRYKWVKVRGLNLENQVVEFEAQGLLARVIQHELDHLNGLVTVDRVDFTQRELIRSKLKRLARQMRKRG